MYKVHQAMEQEIILVKPAFIKAQVLPQRFVVQFVAKRGEVGVHMALADPNYDMSQVKNGIWGSGRVAYQKKQVDMV